MSKTGLILDFHAPRYLREYSLFSIGHDHEYFDLSRSAKNFKRQFKKTDQAVWNAVGKLASDSKKFNVNLSFSGNYLDLLHEHHPEVIELIRGLIKKKQVSVFGSTWANSMSSLADLEVFSMDVQRMSRSIQKMFDVEPVAFRNCENVYFNSLVPVLKKLGFKTTLCERIDWYLEGNNPRQLFRPWKGAGFLIMMVEHPKLDPVTMDDLWQWIQIVPSRVNPGASWEKYLKSLVQVNELVNLKNLPRKVSDLPRINVPNPIGGSTQVHGLNVFRLKILQQKALVAYFGLKEAVLKSGKEDVINDWLSLSCADYIIDMAESNHPQMNQAYDVFSSYMNILRDLRIRIS